ncbi:MAG: VWA domain-containing protein [Gallionella sp.]
MKSTLGRLARGVKKHLGLRSKISAPRKIQRHPQQTCLMDVQRRIRIYLQAMWGCDFVIKKLEGDFDIGEIVAPCVKNYFIHLPDIFQDFTRLDGMRVNGLDTYRAAAAHAAAHIMYSNTRFPEQTLSPWQKAVIGVLEDARVETLSIRKFPGLKQLWTQQHSVTPEHNLTASDYLDRLARALMDETYQDGDTWIEQGRELFKAADNLDSNLVCHNIGLTLALAFENKKIKFNLRSDKLTAPYRDDNLYMWDLTHLDVTQEDELPTAFLNFKLLLTGNEGQGDVADNKDAPVIPSREAIKQVAASDTYVYSEWDYRSQIDTPSWVTLREVAPKPGDLSKIDEINAQHNHLISRMKNLLQAIRYRGVNRIRKLEEGDEIDINAAIRAQMDMRMGSQPDTRIMMRTIRNNRDISVLMLLDLSNSTNLKVHGQDHTVLQLTQQVSVLFGGAIETVGDPFAIHGFCSRSRHDVEYFCFKNFDQAYDDVAKAKIAGMTGQRSTRIGAAIRHATHHLNRQLSNKKLLMIVTDGEPSDVDVQDRQYLRSDTKKAVKDAERDGIHTYCIGMDPKADDYVPRIFGLRNYMVVDHAKSLPEKILLIYAALTL